MLRKRIFSASVFLAFSACLWSAGLAARISGNTPPRSAGDRWAIPGTVVIKFREIPTFGAPQKSGIRAVDKLLTSHGLLAFDPVVPNLPPPSKASSPDLRRVFFARFTSNVPPELLAQQLSLLAEVEYAEPKYGYTLAAIPNDPQFVGSQSAYLNRMHFPQAWDLTKGQDGNVVIAIVDGGSDWTHSDLSANIWNNADETLDGTDSDGNGFIDDVRGWNFANDSNNPRGLTNTPGSANHGTHVAGIAAAHTDNNNLVAGASWNAKVMPVDVADRFADRAITHGYEGIVYAALNGADVINCSWGGSGAPSVFEAEVIEMVNALGAAVVAAAGNGGSNIRHFPSSYDGVLSVANVGNTDLKHGSSNFGPDVSVSAQGINIWSTLQSVSTGFLTGTSMSSPHVAAVAALVKTLHPTWSANEVMEQVRVSSDNIDALNASVFAKLLGFGRVNAHRALTVVSPAIRITHVQLNDTDGDGRIEAGEQVEAIVTVTNYLSAATNIAFTLSESSPFATIGTATAQLPALGKGQSAILPPFVINIRNTTPLQTSMLFNFDVAADGYADRDHFDFVAVPVHLAQIGNNIATSVTSTGRLGFAMDLGGNGNDGMGYMFKNSSNLLFEGALMLGTDVSHISDGARTSRNRFGTEFRTLSIPTKIDPGVIADVQSEARFNDSGVPLQLGVEIFQQSFQFAGPPDDDYIILKYTITNTSAANIQGLRVGWFCDWDVDGGSFGTNLTDFDSQRNLGYTWDGSGGASGIYVGTSVLTAPGATGYRGILNNNALPGNPWGIYDGFLDSEKWQSLQADTLSKSAGPEDVSSTISTGPFDIAPGNSIAIAFAFLGGDNLADLQANADAAAAKWAAIETTTPVTITDFTLEEEAGDVYIRWRTSKEENLDAFAVLRSRNSSAFERLAPTIKPNSRHEYEFLDPQPAPGYYQYRIAEIDHQGSLVLHATRDIQVGGVPRVTGLSPNFPNPFNPSTTLRFNLAADAPVLLSVFDGRGRLVRRLVAGELRPAGSYSETWNGLDDKGRPVSSGLYVARLDLPNRSFSQRMILIK